MAAIGPLLPLRKKEKSRKTPKTSGDVPVVRELFSNAFDLSLSADKTAEVRFTSTQFTKLQLLAELQTLLHTSLRAAVHLKLALSFVSSPSSAQFAVQMCRTNCLLTNVGFYFGKVALRNSFRPLIVVYMLLAGLSDVFSCVGGGQQLGVGCLGSLFF